MSELRPFRAITIFCLFLLLALSFQNCSNTDFGGQGDKTSHLSNSGGQPYDGKPYLLYGVCEGVSTIASKIVVYTSGEAEMVRKDCVDVALTLSATDFILDPLTPGQLIYQGQTFVVAPPPQPAAKAAYSQWSNNLLTIAPAVYAIDGVGYAAARVKELNDSGHTVVCMIDAGVYKASAPDAAAFLTGDIGNATGAVGERWLDTRSLNVRDIMLRRLASAKAKGCGGILWNQTDGFTAANPGFPLTAATGIDYAKFLAAAAHDAGLLVALANTRDIATALLTDFDFVFAESCVSRGTCTDFQGFLDAGKSVYTDEHGAYSAALCSQAAALKVTAWFSTPNGDGSRYEPCP